MSEIASPLSAAPPLMETPKLTKTVSNTGQSLPFQFTGSGGEYFKIWIVNILLSIVTLGIYSAWATVRTKRYFYGNTIFDKASFEYHATPIQILKGRIVALFLVVAYVILAQFDYTFSAFILLLLGLLFPWTVWSSLRFNALMTSYRNVRFGFDGAVGYSYYLVYGLPIFIFLVAIILAMIIHIIYLFYQSAFMDALLVFGYLLAFSSAYWFFPYLQKLYLQFSLGCSTYGQGDFDTQLSTRVMYLIYLQALLIALGFLGAIVGILYSLGYSWSLLKELDWIDVLASLIVIYPLVLLGSIVIKAFLKANIRNHAYNNTQLDHVVRFKASTSFLKLFKLYLLNLFLLVITLGFAYPWNKVRLARYEAETLSAEVHGSLDQYVSQRQAEQSSLGDQLGDVFDLPVNSGLGL